MLRRGVARPGSADELITTLDLGRGVRHVTAVPSPGRVVAAYRAAAYIRFPGGLCALTTGRAPAGPLHLRVAVLPALYPGAQLSTDGTVLRGLSWSVSLNAPTWAGELPPPDRLAAAAADGDDDAAEDGEHWADVGRGSPATAANLRQLIRQRGVAGLAGVIGGRGPGLTPYGDDLLAGVLLVARALWGPGSEAELEAVAVSVPTTSVATAFLRWAACGQCVEPAHRWLAAMAGGDPVAARRSASLLLRTGASSGRGLLSGMRQGLVALPRRAPTTAGCQPRSETQTARAGPRPGLDQ
jgi:Protein of unknown function (DUF2877)